MKKVEIEVEYYQMMYTKLYGVYQEVSKSIVTVSGITSDIDWFNNTYENKGMASGLIIANSGKEIIIITEDKDIVSAESICVTFCDGEQAIATVKKANSTVNLVALSIPIANLKATTLDSISLANIGNSNTLSLIGSPVIAVGSPLGYSGSISYGIITSVGNNLRIVESNYKLITTDIYGSPNASGVLVNLKGQVIGIVHQTDNAGDMKNAVSAIGISELKSLMEKLSNQKESSYLGIYPLDLPKEVIELQNVPKGAYVAEIVMDSPAMKAGIQSGDIIVEMNGETITNIYDYAMILNHLKPDDFINIVVMRQSKQEYQEMNFGIYAGKLE